MAKLRIFLADDHAVVRAGLKTLVNAQSDMIVVGEASDGQAALEQTRGCQAEVVIMDISMPLLNGAEDRSASEPVPGYQNAKKVMKSNQGNVARHRHTDSFFFGGPEVVGRDPTHERSFIEELADALQSHFYILWRKPGIFQDRFR